jgi:hypothetical protein
MAAETPSIKASAGSELPFGVLDEIGVVVVGRVEEVGAGVVEDELVVVL